jgi:hypothetical protein
MGSAGGRPKAPSMRLYFRTLQPTEDMHASLKIDRAYVESAMVF